MMLSLACRRAQWWVRFYSCYILTIYHLCWTLQLPDRLFADDCLIYRSIKSLSDQVTLQRDLEALHDWGELWGLKFNVAKCNLMHLDRKTVSPVRFYTLGGEIISSVTEAKYLGVTLSSKYGTRSSQWKPHITEIATKANQRLGFLRRYLGGCPYRLRELGYLSLVRSLLEYSGGIWDTTTKCEADMLEAVQRRAARWARGARGIISVTALLNELNWQPLSDRRRDQRLSLFYKILHQNLNLPSESVDLRTLKTRTRKNINWCWKEWKEATNTPLTGKALFVLPSQLGTI